MEMVYCVGIPSCRMNRRLCSFLVLLTLAGTARAQLGTGWTEQVSTRLLHAETNGVLNIIGVPDHFDVAPGEFCSYTNAGEYEEFHLWRTNSNRIEVRFKNDYSAPASGRQFEGDVMLLSGTGNECVMQIFGNNSRATLFMLRGNSADGGSLRHNTHETLMTHVYDTWVHVNVIHIPGQSVKVYLNGELKGQYPDDSAAHVHFFKYGCYGTLDTDQAGVRWKNVKMFTGGQPPE